MSSGIQEDNTCCIVKVVKVSRLKKNKLSAILPLVSFSALLGVTGDKDWLGDGRTGACAGGKAGTNYSLLEKVIPLLPPTVRTIYQTGAHCYWTRRGLGSSTPPPRRLLFHRSERARPVVPRCALDMDQDAARLPAAVSRRCGA